MEIYKVHQSPFLPSDYEHFVRLDHPTVPEFRTFKHCNLPKMGVGPEHKSFLYFDDFIDKSLIPEIKEEIEKGLSNGHTRFNKIIANGLVPTDVNGQKTIDSYLANIEKYAKDDRWKEDIQKITRKGDLKTYFHKYFGIGEPWDGLAMFREYTAHYEDKVKPSQWMQNIEQFPVLKKFVNGLPFKFVGYVMIFKSKPNSPVLIHRDYFPVNHRVHFMNIRLEQKPRPFFLYDIESKTKEYMNPEKDIYFFNEIDLHGLDAEPQSHMTLRIEGQFNDDFLNKIGLPDGETFNWNFEKPKSFLKSGNFKIEPSTDI
jgi:hypothetical protein